jgi:hypothetical protein
MSIYKKIRSAFNSASVACPPLRHILPIVRINCAIASSHAAMILSAGSNIPDHPFFQQDHHRSHLLGQRGRDKENIGPNRETFNPNRIDSVGNRIVSNWI